MKNDYTKLIAEFWPTIVRAWEDHADKLPVIECDVVKRQVLAWCGEEYISSLTERTREVTRRQFRRAAAAGGIMVFIRDSRNRVLQSHVFMPDETSESKTKAAPVNANAPVASRVHSGRTRRRVTEQRR